jgi:hypothetical protein
MLVTFEKGKSEIIGVWSGNLNTLETLFPNNPEMLDYLDQLLVDDIQDVINHPENYQVINGQIMSK